MLTPEDLGRLAFDTAAKWAGDNQIRFDEADDELREGMTAMAVAVAISVIKECSAIAGSMAERPYDNEPEFSAVTHVESAIFAEAKILEDSAKKLPAQDAQD